MSDLSSDEEDLSTLAVPAMPYLGLKGALRVRPHGASQKPHLVLRRIKDARHDGTVWFTLFALKKIDCKQGKELLVSIESEDDRFAGQCVVFEGRETADGTVCDLEEDVEKAQRSLDVPPVSAAQPLPSTSHVATPPPPVQPSQSLPALPQAMPPKMRKSWIPGRAQPDELPPPFAYGPGSMVLDPFHIPRHEHAKVSIAIQTQPDTRTVAAQTAVARHTRAAQTYSSRAWTRQRSVQTDATPRQINEQASQTDGHRASPAYISQEVQVDGPIQISPTSPSPFRSPSPQNVVRFHSPADSLPSYRSSSPEVEHTVEKNPPNAPAPLVDPWAPVSKVEKSFEVVVKVEPEEIAIPRFGRNHSPMEISSSESSPRPAPQNLPAPPQLSYWGLGRRPTALDTPKLDERNSRSRADNHSFVSDSRTSTPVVRRQNHVPVDVKGKGRAASNLSPVQNTFVSGRLLKDHFIDTSKKEETSDDDGSFLGFPLHDKQKKPEPRRMAVVLSSSKPSWAETDRSRRSVSSQNGSKNAPPKTSPRRAVASTPAARESATQPRSAKSIPAHDAPASTSSHASAPSSDQPRSHHPLPARPSKAPPVVPTQRITASTMAHPMHEDYYVPAPPSPPTSRSGAGAGAGVAKSGSGSGSGSAPPLAIRSKRKRSSPPPPPPPPVQSLVQRPSSSISNPLSIRPSPATSAISASGSGSASASAPKRRATGSDWTTAASPSSSRPAPTAGSRTTKSDAHVSESASKKAKKVVIGNGWPKATAGGSGSGSGSGSRPAQPSTTFSANAASPTSQSTRPSTKRSKHKTSDDSVGRKRAGGVKTG